MTQLTLDTSGVYTGRARLRPWLKSMGKHAGRVLAFLAYYPPYTLDPELPALSEWKRYEPATKWLEEHP